MLFKIFDYVNLKILDCEKILLCWKDLIEKWKYLDLIYFSWIRFGEFFNKLNYFKIRL